MHAILSGNRPDHTRRATKRCGRKIAASGDREATICRDSFAIASSLLGRSAFTLAIKAGARINEKMATIHSAQVILAASKSKNSHPNFQGRARPLPPTSLRVTTASVGQRSLCGRRIRLGIGFSMGAVKLDSPPRKRYGIVSCGSRRFQVWHGCASKRC